MIQTFSVNYMPSLWYIVFKSCSVLQIGGVQEIHCDALCWITSTALNAFAVTVQAMPFTSDQSVSSENSRQRAVYLLILAIFSSILTWDCTEINTSCQEPFYPCLRSLVSALPTTSEVRQGTMIEVPRPPANMTCGLYQFAATSQVLQVLGRHKESWALLSFTWPLQL